MKATGGAVKAGVSGVRRTGAVGQARSGDVPLIPLALTDWDWTNAAAVKGQGRRCGASEMVR